LYSKIVAVSALVLLVESAHAQAMGGGSGGGGRKQHQQKADKPLYQGELHIDSAPTLVNDVVVVGSAVDDMSRARAPSGTVFAFDPRTGQKRWSFDPVPRRPDDRRPHTAAGRSGIATVRPGSRGRIDVRRSGT
jgi:quinoprotein glucose dehydrogenase